MSDALPPAAAPALPPPDPHFAIDAPMEGGDGPFWPVERAGMRSPRAIVLRLVADFRSLAPDETGPGVTADDLIGLGWRLSQLQAHVDRALAVLNAGNVAGEAA